MQFFLRLLNFFCKNLKLDDAKFKVEERFKVIEELSIFLFSLFFYVRNK